MPELIKMLQSCRESDPAHSSMLEEAIREISDLRQRRDALEEILIILVRTGFPWDADGTTTEDFAHFRERYENAMREASELIGLDLRSTINRTEPRT